MSFGLSNAGATYQSLMEKIFKEIICVDVELYVDDMVMKSMMENEHCSTLDRVFKILRKHWLKLNSEKCSFGVQAGKFLGFMPTKRGIKANPEKFQAVMNMRSPQSMREVDEYGHTHFQYPHERRQCWKLLWFSHGRLQRNNSSREGGETIPGLFYKVLQDAERRYHKFEKAALALTIPSRRLRPYFQGYNIIVQTGLTHLISTAKVGPDWKNGGHIKAQALADFITNLTPGGQFANESNQAGSRAKVTLEGPNGVLIKQSLHFEFKANNNQVEYKALLAEMKLAQELKARILTAKSDS
ncbi:Retrovirus-related Pol polyprotein from transposon 17.6, partial [Mucuna pruriens]